MRLRTSFSMLSAVLLLAVFPAASQEAIQEATVISGQVLSAADGQPLPGAAVSIPELGLSAVCDAEGRYTLTVPAGLAPGRTVEVQASFSDLQPNSARVTL